MCGLTLRLYISTVYDMVLNDDLSEFVGFFIGDGCLSKSGGQQIVLTGSAKRQTEEYFVYLNNVLRENFDVEGNIYHRKDNDVFLLRTNNPVLVGFLLNLGFKFGPKSQTVKIPEKIMENTNLSIACLRGIFNSDGSIYRRYGKKYRNHPKHYTDYFNIQFKSMSLELIAQIKNILGSLGLASNRIIRDKSNGASILRITAQRSVNKFLNVVKINHPHHLARIKSGPRGI